MLLALAACSNNEIKSNGILFPNTTIENIETNNINLTDVFNDYEIVALETTDESFIAGRSTKIIKKCGHYFIKSVNDIIVFDEDGKFINKLSRFGTGPGEYDQLNDFDVVESYGEIWVSASKGIYRYDLNSLDYNGIILLPNIATQFKYLDDDDIIIRTTDEDMFKVCSLEGEILKTFFHHDKANSGYPPFGFIKCGNRIAYQLESSNDVICYDMSSKEFQLENIISPTKDLETTEINREYYERYGYLDQTDKVSEKYIGISTFRNIGDVVLLIVRYPNGNMALNITKGEDCKAYVYSPQNQCHLKNNIAENANPMFYTTLLCGESDDSFIFMYSLEDNPDCNPHILNVKHINL